MKPPVRPRVIATLLMVFALAGCLNLGEPAPPPQYYRLAAMTQTEAAGLVDGPFSLLVGPVTLAGYLDRPELVLNAEGARLQLAERDRWAGPPADNLAQVLAQNLALLLGTTRVGLFPAPYPGPEGLQLRLHLYRFEGDQGRAVLKARWELLDGGRRRVAEGITTEVRQVTGDSPADLVAALNANLEALSREIAAAVAAVVSEKSERPQKEKNRRSTPSP